MSTDYEACFRAKKAFVVGHTGEVGKELVKELLKREVFRKVVLIGRRELSLHGELYKNVEQRVVDFDDLDKHKDAFKDCVVGFCCLGSRQLPMGRESSERFMKVDHDYVVSIAKIARECGTEHFSVVSSAGADKNSRFLFAKIKGLMEKDVADIGFSRFTIFRPGFLLCDREESRISERISLWLLKPLILWKPTLMSVSTNFVAKAMIADLRRISPNRVDIVDNTTIHEMAKELAD